MRRVQLAANILTSKFIENQLRVACGIFKQFELPGACNLGTHVLHANYIGNYRR